eukprot:6214720-Pleurochrysis_carterae.AAC.1
MTKPSVIVEASASVPLAEGQRATAHPTSPQVRRPQSAMVPIGGACCAVTAKCHIHAWRAARPAWRGGAIETTTAVRLRSA